MTEATPAFLPTDTAYKAVDFIQTYTGRAFWPLKPTADALSVIDIAHALSNQCRYTGHVRHFYSVAQHCVLLAEHVAAHGGTPMDCYQMLHHDDPEAYLVDIARPVKQFMPEYRVWDHAIDDVIRKWLGLEFVKRPDFIDELDSRIIVDERAALLGGTLDWGHRMEPIGITIEKWSPEKAEQAFLTLHAAYSYQITGRHLYVNEEWGIPMEVAFRHTASDIPYKAADLMEIDVLGRVGRVRMRDEDGLIVSTAGPQWWHGEFDVRERGK